MWLPVCNGAPCGQVAPVWAQNRGAGGGQDVGQERQGDLTSAVTVVALGWLLLLSFACHFDFAY